jgi:hypothetical protein
MSRMTRRGRLLLVGLTGALLLAAVPASGHSYRDPALTTVLDAVQPALPDGVSVVVRPSVLDELVLTNPTAAPLEVLGADGQPFLRVSSAGVLADLASPDWYLTGVPEGAPALPPYARAGAPARWARVSSGTSWAEFDPRLRPEVQVAAELRAAGVDRVVASWRIPLRYGGRPVQAQGHVVFSPVRGGLVVAVTQTPPGLTATALQGELPGLFVSVPAGHVLDVAGADGRPFLHLAGGRVLAALASPSWRADRAARGLPVSGSGWAQAGTGSTFTWLDVRLRYPHDAPPADQLARQAVLQRWSVPVRLDGRAAAISGTVTWVPRAAALRTVLPAHRTRQAPWLPWAAGGGAAALVAAFAVLRARRRT